MSLLQKLNLKLKKPAISKAISDKAFKVTPKVTPKIAPKVTPKVLVTAPTVTNQYFDDINNDLDKIASFDIGIKNLSYCILSANQSEVKVYDWRIIDLITEILSHEHGHSVIHNLPLSREENENVATFIGEGGNL